MESLNILFDISGSGRRRCAPPVPEAADGTAEASAEAGRRLEGQDGEGPPGTPRGTVLPSNRTRLPDSAAAEYVEHDREAGESGTSGRPPVFRTVLAPGDALEKPDRTVPCPC